MAEMNERAWNIGGMILTGSSRSTGKKNLSQYEFSHNEFHMN